MEGNFEEVDKVFDVVVKLCFDDFKISVVLVLLVIVCDSVVLNVVVWVKVDVVFV